MTPRPLRVLAAVLLLVALLTQSYIDLEVAADLGGWHANAPLADVAALLLVPLAAWGWLRGQRHPLPGLPGYLLLLVAASLSLLRTPDLAASLHTLIRKPLFLYVAYAFAAAWAAQHAVRRRVLIGGVLAWAASTAGVSLLTSGARIFAGDTLWFQQIAGLTPNHKTLAVSLAGGLPLLLAHPRYRRAVPLLLAAIVLSASKTAVLMALLALGLFYPTARPLAWRLRLAVPLAILGVLLAYYAPLIVDSRAMLDAARSRHSLNHRAWLLFAHAPLTGSGIGISTVAELNTFPHYRVNGVDAHGVIQKIAGELGLLGLVSYATFTAGTGLALYRRWQQAAEDPLRYGALAAWGVSTAGLLLSTETFSQTWWLPLAITWGLAHTDPEDTAAAAQK